MEKSEHFTKRDADWMRSKLKSKHVERQVIYLDSEENQE